MRETQKKLLSILHVIGSLDPAGGGPPAVVSRLAAAQAELGHAVTILTYQQPDTPRFAQSLEHEVPGMAAVKIRSIPFVKGIKYSPGASRQIDDHVSAASVVHLHGVWEPLLLAAGRAARLYGVPYASAPHGMLYPWSLKQKRLKKTIALALGYKRMLQHAAFLHLLNQDECHAVEPLGLKPPVEIIPNGIFLEEFTSLPQPGTFRHEYPAVGPNPFILFLSRLHPGKGLDCLAKAFAILAPRMPDVNLVVAGPDAGARQAFESLIAEAGLQNRVFVIGPVYGPAKLAAYRDAACFCLPSHHETFSMAITEAMACGVPVVVSENCHFAELAQAGAGRVVPLDERAVGEALIEVLSDKDLQAQMGRAGKELVASRYTWPNIVRQLIEAYGRMTP